MIRSDKRNIHDIKKIIDWCQQDSFWHINILSTAKLREKFDQLTLNMNKQPNNKKENNERKYKTI